MIGLFVLNPPEAKARLPSRRWRPRSFSINDKKKRRKRMFFTANPRAKKRKVGARRGWWRDKYGHGFAAKIGWTYRKHPMGGSPMFRSAARPVGKRGKNKGLSITERSLKSYRRGRKLSARALEARRARYTEKRRKTVKRRTYMAATKRAKRHYGALLNRGATSYQKFVGKFIRSRRVSGRAGARSAMRAAAKAWRSGRRSGRNPVLPMALTSWNDAPSFQFNKKRRKSGRKGKRHYAANRKRSRKGRKAHRNPVYRLSSGKFAGRHYRGTRKLHRIKGGGWKANAILPYAAFNNPVEAITGTFERLTEVDLWTETILPITGGFIGSKIVSYQAVKMLAPAGTKFEGIVKHGATLGASILLSAGTGIVSKNPDMAAKVLAGGLVNFLGGVLDDLLGDSYKKAVSGMSGMNDLADDLTDDLKRRIAAGVRQQIEGGDSGGGVSAFVTQQDLNAAPRLGDFVTQQNLQMATAGTGLPARAGGGPPRANDLADLSTFQDALADGSLI